MSDQPLVPGRPYLVKIQTRELAGTVSVILGREDVTTGHQVPARSLEMNEIAIVSLDLHHPVPYQPYKENRRMGAFILVDRITSATVGAGMIDSALDQARNLHWQTVEVTREARAAHLGQKPRCLWFTGLSGSGKSTLANLVEKRLHLEGRHTFILDGDNIRHGLNRDLGFSEADRAENIRRISEVARLMTDAGLIVLVAFISPFRMERDLARGLFPEGEFIEIFVDAPLEVCETRDPKGLYSKARSGLIEQFTGIDSAYETPEHPELHLRTDEESVQSCVERILDLVR